MGSSRGAPSFADLFGAAPAVRASAPGRVNVIGEHTDYNGGFVLPAAIPQRTSVELKARPDTTVELWSREAPGRSDVSRYALGTETPQRDWTDYVAGLTHLLAKDGHRLTGFALRLESTVPVGSGLSSSAALQVAVLRALREAFAVPLDDDGLATLAHRAETGFVGAPVGIMDQMACSLADEAHVLFLDTRSRSHERIPLPRGTALIVIDSAVAHSHASGDYRQRRAECDRAAALLGVAELRDVAAGAVLSALPPPLDRRARHVVTENARVLATVDAFRAQDPIAAGALLSQSHASMRDDFEVSIPEVDLLVALAGEQPEVFGARLTGGGFGGAVVALARGDSASSAAHRIAAAYAAETRLPPRVLVPRAAQPDSRPT